MGRMNRMFPGIFRMKYSTETRTDALLSRKSPTSLYMSMMMNSSVKAKSRMKNGTRNERRMYPSSVGIQVNLRGAPYLDIALEVESDMKTMKKWFCASAPETSRGRSRSGVMVGKVSRDQPLRRCVRRFFSLGFS